MHNVLNILNDLATYFGNIPSGFWEALLASGVLSPFLKAYKHLIGITNEKVMLSLVVFASAVIAASHYLLTITSQNPSIIAVQTAILAFMTQPIYFFVVKPLWLYIAKHNAEADIFNETVKSAAIPPEGLPVAGTSVSAQTAQQALHNSLTIEDFSH